MHASVYIVCMIIPVGKKKGEEEKERKGRKECRVYVFIENSCNVSKAPEGKPG